MQVNQSTFFYRLRVMKFLENASAMYFDQPYEGFLPSPLNIAVFTRVFVIDYYIVDLRFYF